MPTSHTSDRDSPDLTALHAILAFLVTVLINLVQVQFQEKHTSPFDTHPFATTLAIFCLLFYCSLALVAHLSLAPACRARAFPILMMLTALLSVASFLSLLFRRPFHSFPYLLSLVLLSMVLLSVFVHGFRPSHPADQPSSPVRAPDVRRDARHQHPTGNDFQIRSTDSGSSTAASNGELNAEPQPCVATQSLQMAEGDGEVRLEVTADREGVDGPEN